MAKSHKESRVDRGTRSRSGPSAGGVPSGPLEAAASAVPGWARWVLPLSVIAVTFVTFVPALQNEFVNWDDDKVLVDNDAFRGLGGEQFQWMFTTYHMGHYHPLTWMSFAVDYSVWGIDDAFGFHLTNLVLHALNAGLFYFLAVRLLALAMPARYARYGWALRGGAVLAALLFGVHPLRVESVAWATERRDVLSIFFLIPSVLCYLRYASGAARRQRWYAGAVALLLLSLLSKAWGMTLPAVLIVLDFYPLRRLRPDGKGPRSLVALRLLVEKIPFFALAAWAAYMAAHAQSMVADTMKTLEEYGLTQRVAQAFYGLGFYLWKTILPTALAPLYEIPVEMSPFEPRFVAAAVAVLAATALAFAFRRRWPGGLALWAVYVITVSPVLGLAQCGPQLAADRYSYISCMTWALLAGAGVLWCARGWSGGRLRSTAVGPLAVAAVAAIAVLAVLTWRQTHVWRTSQTLWEHNLAVYPNTYYAHYNLGTDLANREHFDRAIEEYTEVLRIQPRHTDAHRDLGRALEKRGETRRAIEHYVEALRIRPDLPDVHELLGAALLEVGEIDEAARHFDEAWRLKPDPTKALNARGMVLAHQGRMDEAVDCFAEAVRLKPDCPDMRFDLGLALAKLGRFDLAAEHFAESVRVRPDRFAAQRSLARVLRIQGELDRSLVHYLEAARLRPDSAEVHGSLGSLLAQQGKIEKAVAHYREALRYAPDSPAVASSLAWLLATNENPRVRDGAEAVRLAEQACRATEFREPVFLDTLAAAYAEAGRFDDAIQILRRVIAYATAAQNQMLMDELERKLRLYQAGRPYRDTR